MTQAAGGRRAQIVVPTAVVLGWVGLWLATVPLGEFPLNDDWVYGLAVRSVVDTGHLSILPWSAANAFAQIYWGALFCELFGYSYETLRLSTAVLGAVGVGATYALLREFRAGTGVAALGALVVGCNPLYLSQSVTFMTDVPFAAAVIVSLWLFVRSLRLGPGLGWGAYGVGLVAVLIRQFAVVLPVAFAAAVLRRRRLSLGVAFALLGSVLLFAALHLGFQKWMVATGRTSGFESPVTALLHLDVPVASHRLRTSILPLAGLLGMGLLPFAIVDPGRFGQERLAWRVLAVALAVAMLAGFYVKHEIPPLAGNVVQPFGIGPLTLLDTYEMKRNLPVVTGQVGFWWVVSAGACWGAVIGLMATASLVAATLSGRREGSEAQSQAAVLLGFVAAYGGAVLVFVAIAPLFDRYWIPLLAPLVAIVAAASGGRIHLVAGAVLVAAMAAFSVMGTHDWLAWQRSRWEAVRYLDAQSIPASKIDGGYEFNGTRTYRPGSPSQSGKPGWWIDDNEYAIAAGPRDGYSEIARFPVDTWLWRDGARIVVLHRD